MKKTGIFALTMALVLSLSAVSWISAVDSANKAVTEGAITYVLDIESDDIPAMAEFMLKGSELVIRFKDQFVRTEFDMSMMSTSSIVDGEQNEGLMLMSVMGNKWAIKLDGEALKQQSEQRGNPEIVYLDETKKIAGYTCKKATIKSEEGEVTLFYTDKIQPKNLNTQYTYEGLRGVPLQFEMNLAAAGTHVTMIAKEVSTDKQDASLFSLKIPEGYTEKTLEELQSMQGK